jgi:hypothetical protein
MVRNPARGSAAVEPLKACPMMVTLTAGVAYAGDTTGQLNKYSGTDYPGLGWAEEGPDVVHQINVSALCDLRIHVDPDPVMFPDLDVILIDNTGGACDTANWFLAGDHTIVYPDCPAGTYYIIVDGYTKDDVGTYTLTAACSVNLLVVDGDGSPTIGQCGAGACPDVWVTYYKAALDGMSPVPTYTIWDKTANGGNLPAQATLNNYKSVLWFTGRAFGDNLTSTPPVVVSAADETALRKYFNLGGRVVMIGQDILWDLKGGNNPGRLPDGDVLNDYFQVNSVQHDVWSSSTTIAYPTCSSTYNSIPVWGVPGNPMGDDMGCDTALYLSCLYALSNGAPFPPNVDAITSRFGEPVYDTSYRAANTNTLLPAAIRYNASLGIVDWFKTAFFAFAPECNRMTGDTTTVITRLRGILTRTLNWFEQDDSTLRGESLAVYGYFDDSGAGNNNGYPDPGETFTFTVEVDNNDTVAHSVKASEGFEDWYTDLGLGPWCADLGTIPAGGYALADFTMTLDAATPTGYRLQPLFNISEYFGGTETFEGATGFDTAGWTYGPLTGTTDWAWSTAQSQSPTHSWFAQDVGSVNDKVLVTPEFGVLSTTTVSFYHMYTFEGTTTCYDAGTLEYAVGPGFGTWTVVPDAWFTANGFNGTTYTGYSNPIAGKRAWCFSLGSWTQVSLGLSALAGQTVKLRWHEGDDSSTAATGWYVDSLTLSNTLDTFTSTAGFGTFVGQADVLLVKDEYWYPNTTGVDTYKTKIEGIAKPAGGNFTTAVWDTAMFAAPTYANPEMGLSNDWMRNYPFVVWFTGFDFAYTLLPDPWEQSLGVNPEIELNTFLNNRSLDMGDPARFIFSSQDYLYDKYAGQNTPIPAGDFASVQLKTSYVTQDYIKDTDGLLKGINGVWPGEKMQMGLQNGPVAGGAPFKNYADMVSGNFDEAATQYLWTYSATSTHGAMVNVDKTRASRFAYMAFALENVQDGPPDGFPSKRRFLQKLMCQMLMTSASTVPPCGYSAPACTPDPTIYGRRQGTDASFTWTPGSFTNTALEPIFGRFRMYGKLNAPNPSGFDLLAVVPGSEYVGDQTVGAGQCFYYLIKDYVDDFDQAGAICP